MYCDLLLSSQILADFSNKLLMYKYLFIRNQKFQFFKKEKKFLFLEKRKRELTNYDLHEDRRKEVTSLFSVLGPVCQVYILITFPSIINSAVISLIFSSPECEGLETSPTGRLKAIY